ncbi:MAG TPA: TIGR04053 family radical SAM/SPASM domain-containing protein [Tepidisphaeraceae bacterium]|jgi:radical SAM protein
MISSIPYTRSDFGTSPMLVFFETTRACDLKCRHCRAEAQKKHHPQELTTQQAEALIDELTTFPKPPMLVFTGGDPLKRRDIFHLVAYAHQKGIHTAMTPSATPLVTADAIRRLKESGLQRFAVSLDGADAATHDDFRRVNGSFQRTMEIIRDARAAGLPVQINTTVGRHNVGQIDAIAELLAGMDIVLWSVFFLVPMGRATIEQRIAPKEYERVFEKLWLHTKKQPYAIKTTEAPQYRRFLLEMKRREKLTSKPDALPKAVSPMVGTNDGRGVMFVSHIGEIFPSGFLPLWAGRFPFDSLVSTYQKSAVFVALRDSKALGGKCGGCEYNNLCGGSRARAFALTDDPLAAEPDCTYVPPRVADEATTCLA